MDTLKNKKIIQRIISLFLCAALIFTSVQIDNLLNKEITAANLTSSVDFSESNSGAIKLDWSAMSGTNRTFIDAGKTVTLEVPSTAKYLTLTIVDGGNNN